MSNCLKFVNKLCTLSNDSNELITNRTTDSIVNKKNSCKKKCNSNEPATKWMMSFWYFCYGSSIERAIQLDWQSPMFICTFTTTHMRLVVHVRSFPSIILCIWHLPYSSISYRKLNARLKALLWPPSCCGFTSIKISWQGKWRMRAKLWWKYILLIEDCVRWNARHFDQVGRHTYILFNR